MKHVCKIWMLALAFAGFLSMITYSCKSVNEPIIITGTVKDIDGNLYDTLAIGTQVWLVQNLRTTHFQNGDSIPNITVDSLWSQTTTGAYCSYNRDASNAGKYGLLYNWYAVTDSRNIAPAGWHVATDAEWTTLENYLIANGYNYNDSTYGNFFAKSLAATTDWASSINIAAIGNDLTKNNKSGFIALPGGYRYSDGTFHDLSFYGFWWSPSTIVSTTDYFRLLNNNNWNDLRGLYSKKAGLSIRCVKN